MATQVQCDLFICVQLTKGTNLPHSHLHMLAAQVRAPVHTTVYAKPTSCMLKWVLEYSLLPQ